MSNSQIIVSPSILAADFSNISGAVQAMIEAGADYIHYDVMDNHFVPNLTFGDKFVADAMQTKGIKSDIHLMIEKPEESLDRFLALQPDLVTFHLEACPQPGDAIKKIHANNCKAGLSIKPATDYTTLRPWLAELDTVLIMLVEPGFGGQKMLPETVRKIELVRQLAEEVGTEIEIQIDGGIKKDNFQELVDLGATNLVMGSGIFNESDHKAVIDLVKSYTPSK